MSLSRPGDEPCPQETEFIHLDHTLHDLYADSNTNRTILLIPIFPSSRIGLAPSLSSNAKYLLYESSLTEPQLTLENPDPEKLRQILSLRRLTDFAQNMIFTAGSMTVVLVDPHLPHPPSHDIDQQPRPSQAYAEEQLAALFKIISPEQQPKIRWVKSNLQDLALERNEVLAPIMALDDLQHQHCIMHPDLHYQLASKESLAHSGLKTPKSEIISFDDALPPCLPEMCCAACQNCYLGDVTKALPLNCSGPCGIWLNHHIESTISRVRGYALPYVLKLTQACGGAGTFILRSSEDLDDICEFLERTYLPVYLPLLTSGNLPLKPVNIVLQDYHPGKVYAVAFFVGKDGECRFLCCTQQNLNAEEGGKWAGSSIVFSEQAHLEKRMRMVSTLR